MKISEAIEAAQTKLEAHEDNLAWAGKGKGKEFKNATKKISSAKKRIAYLRALSALAHNTSLGGPAAALHASVLAVFLAKEGLEQ